MLNNVIIDVTFVFFVFTAVLTNVFYYYIGFTKTLLFIYLL